MLLAINLYEYFIDVESIAETSVLALQSTCIDGTKLDTPESDRFAAYGDTSFGQEIFNIAVAEIETEVEPDSVGNDIGRESVALISIHKPILSKLGFNLSVPSFFLCPQAGQVISDSKITSLTVLLPVTDIQASLVERDLRLI